MKRNSETSESSTIERLPVYAILELANEVVDPNGLHFRNEDTFLDKVASIICAAYPEFTGLSAKKLRDSLPLMLDKIRSGIYRKKNVQLSHACEAAVSVCFFEIHQAKKDAEVRLFFESGLIVIQYIAALVGQLKHFTLYNNIAEISSRVEQRYDESLAYDKERYPDKGMDDAEKEKLLHFANCIKVCLSLINNPAGKRTRVIRLVTALVEGPTIKYISGSGMTPLTRRRITLFEEESGIFPRPPTAAKVRRIYTKITGKKANRRNNDYDDDEDDNDNDDDDVLLGSYSSGNRSSYVVNNDKLRIDSQEVVNNDNSISARINRVEVGNQNVYTSYVQTMTTTKPQNRSNSDSNRPNKKSKSNDSNTSGLDSSVSIPIFPSTASATDPNQSVFELVGFDNVVPSRHPASLVLGYDENEESNNYLNAKRCERIKSINDVDTSILDDFDAREADATDDEDLDLILNEDDVKCLMKDPEAFSIFPDMEFTTNTSEVDGTIIHNVVFSTRNSVSGGDSNSMQQLNLNEICQFADESAQQEFFDDMVCTLTGGITHDESGACAFTLTRISTLDRAFSAVMRSVSQTESPIGSEGLSNSTTAVPAATSSTSAHHAPTLTRQVSFLDPSRFLFRGISLSDNNFPVSKFIETNDTQVVDDQPTEDYDTLLSTA